MNGLAAARIAVHLLGQLGQGAVRRAEKLVGNPILAVIGTIAENPAVAEQRGGVDEILPDGEGIGQQSALPGYRVDGGQRALQGVGLEIIAVCKETILVRIFGQQGVFLRHKVIAGNAEKIIVYSISVKIQLLFPCRCQIPVTRIFQNAAKVS